MSSPTDVTVLESIPLRREATAGLPAHYRHAVQAGDAGALTGLYAPDVLLDAHVPGWRFQVQGREAVADQMCVLPRPGRFTAFDGEPTASGLLIQFEWRQDEDAGGALVRQLHTWRLDEGRIAEHVVFCAGVWGRQLQARMAAEAPLLRP